MRLDRIARAVAQTIGGALLGVGILGVVALNYVYIDREMTEGAFIKEYWHGVLLTVFALGAGAVLAYLVPQELARVKGEQGGNPAAARAEREEV